MRYYIIAGEPSGDLHGANCIRELKRLDANAVFAFTGGERMEAETNGKADIPLSQMAFMGFVDVLKNIGKIRRNFRTVKEKILAFKPDVLLLIDYPGFNLRMAKWATGKKILVDYYISPTVWAWKENRVEKVRNYTHRMLVILPFEEPFYRKHNHQVFFVGHPLIDEIEKKRSALPDCAVFRKNAGLDEKPLIAVLPGSRVQEISRMLKIMMEVKKDFPGHEFVIAGSSSVPRRFYRLAEEAGVKVVFDQTYELMNCAVAGIIKSGTSVLESALFRLPQVVCYKGGALSVAIGRRLVKVKFISLVNLIMGREVVRELIQGDMTAQNISGELRKMLFDQPVRERILREYDELRSMLGGAGASQKVAGYVYNDAKNAR